MLYRDIHDILENSSLTRHVLTVPIPQTRNWAYSGNLLDLGDSS
jgi:hypothetical protein